MRLLSTTIARIEIKTTLSSILFVALIAYVATSTAQTPFFNKLGISALVLGLVIGIIYGNTINIPNNSAWATGINFSARKLLRIAVGLYGLNISVQEIVSIGVNGILLSLCIVVSVLVLGTFIGQKVLGLDRDTALLTAAGSAICGAAAVLAFESTLKSAPHKSSIAIASVVLFGSLSVFLYPFLYHTGVLELSAHSLGFYIGGTVHEVAQVVATASNIDTQTTDTATIIKMTRVALLIPSLLFISFLLRRRKDSTQATQKLPIPWFIIAFVMLALLNSLITLPHELQIIFKQINTFLLTMSMVAIGIETHFQQIRQAGVKVLGLGLILYGWLLIAGYLLVRIVT